MDKNLTDIIKLAQVEIDDLKRKILKRITIHYGNNDLLLQKYEGYKEILNNYSIEQIREAFDDDGGN